MSAAALRQASKRLHRNPSHFDLASGARTEKQHAEAEAPILAHLEVRTNTAGGGVVSDKSSVKSPRKGRPLHDVTRLVLGLVDGENTGDIEVELHGKITATQVCLHFCILSR